MKISREDFCNAANDIWLNHGVYWWGGNGETVESMTLKKLRTGEQTSFDFIRMMFYILLCYLKDWDMTKAQLVDCSGLVVSILRKLKAISSVDDFRAKDLQAMSTPVKLTKLKPGDLVFNKKSDASHVGIYIGYDMTIEAQGRLYGVTKRALKDGSWVVGGTLPYFN